jgi:hopanoid C-3 methylase
MKILLVMPTPFENGRLGLENVVWLSEPVALTSIAAAVSGEHEVRVLDMRLEPEDALARELAAFEPHVVGTTSMTTDVYQALAVLRMARQIVPDALTVVGGHAATLQPSVFDEPFVDVVVQGEGELTFEELVRTWDGQRGRGDRRFPGVAGLRFRDERGTVVKNEKRQQTKNLDDLPAPDRRLLARYKGRYFFTVARNMASIFTSRGCSFDCNFCAIWEFYERRTRYLSAAKIVDQMEACDEPFIFLLDDNFLTSKKRILALCEELERRQLKKFWMTQGRTDFVADNPEIMARLAKNGLVGLLSGFESNDDDNLASLRKKNTWDNNIRANQILRELGIFATGIFMVRADWERWQFQALYDYINSLEIGIPLVTILTPLPGTQLYRAYQNQLMTTDLRLFDLLHAVLPTRLPREEFYAEFARSIAATKPSAHRAIKNTLKNRPDFTRAAAKNFAWFFARTWRYQAIHSDPQSFLRDEQGLLDGPGARAGLTYADVQYPDGREHDGPGNAAVSSSERGQLVRLRIPRRIWADELPNAETGGASAVGAE